MKIVARIFLKVLDVYLYICGIFFILCLIDSMDLNRKEELGSDYTYWHNNSEITGRCPQLAIPGYITEFENDSLFIIAKQRSENRLNYWIIDKTTREIYCTTDISQFNHQCDSLNVNLSFDKERE